MTPPAVVSEVLRDYGAVVRDAVRAYLPPAEPRRYLYDLVADYPGRGGKMMRPSLCIAVARALGAPLDPLLIAAAASIELMHNAMLIHDDIEDESDRRRGEPTLHSLWGNAMAINAGDALAMTSLRPLLDVAAHTDPLLALGILEETEHMARESAEGQALELGWRADNVVALEERDYFEMVLKKTCWLATIHPVRLGALIAVAGRVDPTAFVRFGFFLGAAFQIQYDVLNLAGDTEVYGKETAGDLREGKRTLMIIRLLQLATADERVRLVAHLGTPMAARTGREVGWIRDRIDHYGCIDYARQVAHAMAGAALEEYARLFAPVPPSRDRAFLEGLITWVVERTS
ncbi:MAG: polyprenyl synthetase family protein [Deltaproteobacteria bacterium]|nr:MAG: polyprenyl synthetase family protein [Deltaproteobacteria bacterium]